MPPHDDDTVASAPATSLEDASDIALMAEVKTGSESAFQVLVERHQFAVIGTVAKMLGSPNDAEDIAQQVFVRIWKSAKRYKPTAKFTTWMFTITRNLVFNETRRRSRRKEVSADEREEVFHQTIADSPSAEPARAALHQELEDVIDASIQRLPEKQRMAVILRRFEDMPYDEIGKVLKLSLSAVKSQLFRARVQMKEDLEKYLSD